jgi:C4-dicarboxylate-specific signal transduction histidine kinase
MTGSGKSTHDVPLEASIPTGAVPLQAILCTEELRLRPSRPADYEKENRALVALASALADSPQTILQTLADKVLAILEADSAGLSLLTKDTKRFYWAAIAGAWRPHIGGGTPRDFGPCGDVLDRNVPMLFTHWERRYPYLSMAMPLADEGLLVPFYANGKAVGTIWAIAHTDGRKFDAEDLRLLESMGRFASAAHQVVESVENLRLEIAGREKAEIELRELTDGLEAQVQVRTEELRRSAAFLAEAQRLSSTGSFSWRVGADEITWSEQLYRIFEFDQGMPVSLGLIASRVHPEDLPSLQAMIDRARSDGGNIEYEHRLQMPDRSVKHLHMVAHGTRDREGQLEYIGAVQDVTERRLSEEALGHVRSELAHVARVTSLGALTASIAHEVNQPLSGIITNASTCLRMLAGNAPNLDGARETARRTIRDGLRASEVMTRLRTLFGKRGAVTEAVNLNDAAREVIALSLRELQRSRVILRTNLADYLPPLTGDRVQLQQVILNLLLNAADAMSSVDDRPRHVVIRTELEEGDRVRLAVKDTGVGFDPQSADRLFEAFYTTKSSGMGIGLSVSRSIIESHGGSIWAAPNEGPGATFAFSIPRAPEGPKGGRAASASRTAVPDAEHAGRSS